MEQLPDKLNSEKNRSVLEYISGLSAHSDVAEALEIAITPLGAAHTYWPDPDNYRYLVAYVNETVFSYAVNGGNLKVLNWLKLSGCPFDDRTRTSYKPNDFDTIDWVKINLK